MCASTCIHCKDLDCSATTGSCNQGCNNGWFGEMCDRSCPSNCQTCDQTSGTCTTCKSLYYGPATNCGQVCSGRCAQTNGPRQCDQSTGACLAGCQDGFYGSDCAEACGNCESGTCNSQDGSCSAQGCAAGWFGSQCKQSCNQNCARGGNSNSARRDPNTGSCSYGCVDGYHGSRCTSVCNSRCLNNRCTGATQCTDGCTMGYYGSGCSSECRNCVQGACNSAGVCQNGCLNGYYGTSCTDACWETCWDNSCDVTSGGCSACLTSPKGARCRDEDPVAAGQIDKNDLTTGEIVGIAGGCIAIVIIFVVVFVCCIIYMRRAEDAKNEIHLPSDLVERLSTHRSLHSTVSTNYPVARVVGDPEKDFVLF